jgi:hypothetical protein
MREVETMRRTYTIASIERVLDRLEETFGMTTDAFVVAYAGVDPVPSVPPFLCHVWASFAEDRLRMRTAEDAFGDQVERVLVAG